MLLRITLLLLVLFTQGFCSKVFAQQLKDQDLSESQIQTLKALQDINPKMTPYSGIKGFYLFYGNKRKIEISSSKRTSKKIVDISLFATLPKLEELSLSELNTSSFEVLKKLPNLKKLSIKKPRARIDLNSIFQISKLQELTISYCKYTTTSTLEGLEKLKNLEYLRLERSDIKDLKPIFKAVSLEAVIIRDMNIEFNDSWKSLTNLESIKIRNCNISNTNFLKDCKSLKYVYLGSNAITSLSLPWENLEELYVDRNKISSLAGIEQSQRLKWLNLSSNSVSDISYLSNHKTLEHLNANWNNINNICVLKDIKSLKRISVSGNPYGDASCLRDLPNLEDFESSIKNNQPYPCSPQNLQQLKAGVSCSALEAGWYGSKLHYTHTLLFFFVVGLLFVIRYRIKKSKQLKES